MVVVAVNGGVQGEFLLVGLWSDEDIAEIQGPGHPVMGLHERSLHVLAHRCVDEVCFQHQIIWTNHGLSDLLL